MENVSRENWSVMTIYDHYNTARFYCPLQTAIELEYLNRKGLYETIEFRCPDIVPGWEYMRVNPPPKDPDTYDSDEWA